MKKVLSMIIALSTVATMGVSAFASDADVITQEAEKKMVLSFGQETFDQLLLPGETYQFPLYLNEEGSNELIPVKDEHVKDSRFRAEVQSGKSAISSFKVEEIDDIYTLEVKAEAGWPTKQTDVESSVKLVDKSNGEALAAVDADFTIGYANIDDETLDIAGDGEYIYIDSETPVISTEQFDKLDKAVDGEKVTFTNGKWRYEVRISGQESLNMLHNERAIKEISTKYEDQNFKYVSFPGGPTFDFTGTLSIDVSNDIETFDSNFHVYRYLNGALTKVDANFDKEEETLSFDTKTLGRFVITDKEILDSKVVEEVVTPDSSESTSDFQGGPETDDDKNTNDSNTETNIKENPNTGSDDMLGFAAAAALLSLATATVLAKKKNK